MKRYKVFKSNMSEHLDAELWNTVSVPPCTWCWLAGLANFFRLLFAKQQFHVIAHAEKHRNLSYFFYHHVQFRDPSPNRSHSWCFFSMLDNLILPSLSYVHKLYMAWNTVSASPCTRCWLGWLGYPNHLYFRQTTCPGYFPCWET